MSDWKKAFFRYPDYREIRTQYRLLLSLGLDEEETEKRIISGLVSDEDQSSFHARGGWIALALTQWDYGRLSPTVKEKALQWLRNSESPYPNDLREKIEITLQTPMQPQKPVRRPSVRKCPWSVGSVLAYKIATNEKMKEEPYWNKYVLLRVMAVNRRPISYLAPELLCNESMTVALYGWVGDAIPAPEITKDLRLIPISIWRSTSGNRAAADLIKEIGRYPSLSDELIKVLTTERKVHCYVLDWGNLKEQKTAFTYVGRCQKEETDLPRVPDIRTEPYTIAGLCSFDITVSKRMKELFG